MLRVDRGTGDGVRVSADPTTTGEEVHPFLTVLAAGVGIHLSCLRAENTASILQSLFPPPGSWGRKKEKNINPRGLGDHVFSRLLL